MKIAPYVVYFNDKLIYDPVFGTLTWRTRPRNHFISEPMWRRWNTKYAGRIVGHRKMVEWRPGGKGGIRIEIDGLKYYAHRIIWEIVYGHKPDKSLDVDHINRNPHDNRLFNLRLLTRSQNLHNAAANSRNSTGARGVTYHKRDSLYRATIKGAGVTHRLGSFKSIDDAIAARKEAEGRLLVCS